MAKFRPGVTAYAANGLAYVVDDVADGVVYCSLPSGAESEFPEAVLLTEAEWQARSDKRRDLVHDRLKQSRAYTEMRAKLDPAACQHLLAKGERLSPGLLDFTAFTVATRIVVEAGDRDLIPGLSIAKCRAAFDAARLEIRAGLLADLLGTPPDILVGAGRLGDNLMRAMLDKGMAANAAAFEAFRARRRQ
jgi:hypothetical protein